MRSALAALDLRRGARRLRSGFLAHALRPAERASLSIRRYDASYDPAIEQTRLYPWEEVWFGRRLPAPPAHILVGACGGGREARVLRERGYRVTAFEPARAPRHHARRVLGDSTRVLNFDFATLTRDALGALGPVAPIDAVLLGWGAFSHVADAAGRTELLRACCALTSGPILVSFFVAGDLPLPRPGDPLSALGVRLGKLAGAARGAHGIADSYSLTPWGGFLHYLRPHDIELAIEASGRSVAWVLSSRTAHFTLRALGDTEPEPEPDRLESRRLSALLVRKLADDVGSYLAEAGIASMPLKGAHLTRWVYDDPAERPSSDADVLVSPSRFDDAVCVLERVGFAPVASTQQATVLVSPRYPVPLDLHRALAPHGMFRFDVDEVLERGSARTCGGPLRRVMHDTDLFIHLCTHFAVSRFDERHEQQRRDLQRVAALVSREAVARQALEVCATRAVRHTLRVALAAQADARLAGILAALPRDLFGEVISTVTRRLLTPEEPLTGTLTHLLDTDLASAARTARAHLGLACAGSFDRFGKTLGL